MQVLGLYVLLALDAGGLGAALLLPARSSSRWRRGGRRPAGSTKTTAATAATPALVQAPEQGKRLHVARARGGVGQLRKHRPHIGEGLGGAEMECSRVDQASEHVPLNTCYPEHIETPEH